MVTSAWTSVQRGSAGIGKLDSKATVPMAGAGEDTAVDDEAAAGDATADVVDEARAGAAPSFRWWANGLTMGNDGHVQRARLRAASEHLGGRGHSCQRRDVVLARLFPLGFPFLAGAVPSAAT